jgi:hypothetical protein
MHVDRSASGASASSSSSPSVYGEQVEELCRRQDDGEGLHADLQQKKGRY